MNYKSKFGFGCMRLPKTDENDPTSIDQELFNEMVDVYMERDSIILIHLMLTTMVQAKPLLKRQ